MTVGINDKNYFLWRSQVNKRHPIIFLYMNDPL